MALRDALTDNALTSSVDKLRKELDRWMDVALDHGERAIGTLAASADNHAPRIDIYESKDEVVVRLNLAGVDPASIDLTLVGNMLTVVAPIAISPPETGQFEAHRQERPIGSFKRSIALPAAVDPESVSADSKFGVVEVRMTKPLRDRGRTIAVTVASGASSEDKGDAE